MSRTSFKSCTKYIDKNRETKGIPQGSPISSVLSNIYMLDFDHKINQYVSEHSGKYLRYSDDFIIIIPFNNNLSVDKIEKFIYQTVDEVPNLDLQTEKTQIYEFDGETLINSKTNEKENIDYLGFVFDGVNIRIRPKSISKYYYRMHRKAKNAHHCKTKARIKSPKNLYLLYSQNNDRQTFVSYANRAARVMNLKDPEADALIKYNKQKIRRAINKNKK